MSGVSRYVETPSLWS